MKRHLLTLLILFLFISGFISAQEEVFIRVSVEDYPDFSRVFMESSQPLSISTEKSDSYIMVRVRTNHPFQIQRNSFQSRRIKSVEWVKGSDYCMFTIKLFNNSLQYKHSLSRDSSLFMVDIGSSFVKPEEDPNDISNHDTKTYSGSSSNMSSGEELRTIVIDPGHGGLETGAEGRFGTKEKTVTLDIAKKLKRMIERNLPFRVQLTREEDVDVSLDRRAAIANNYKAYIFISIHANGSYRKTARGSETFFLSLNATDEETRKLAYMENNSTELEGIQSDETDDIKLILWDMAQSSYIRQSSVLAEKIQTKLNTLSGTLNRGVKQAPFKVLTGVACPAVLVETAFISNPEEEKKLVTDDFQDSLARAVYEGLAEFLEEYSHQ